MAVVEILADSEDYEDAHVTIDMEDTGERVAISMFKSKAHTLNNWNWVGLNSLPLVDRLIRLIAQSLSTDDVEEQRKLEDMALDPIYDAVQTLNPNPASSDEPSRSTTSHQSLHCLLFPKVSHYRLEAVYEAPVLVPISADEACRVDFDDESTLNQYQSEIEINPSLPLYSTEQIAMIEVFGHGLGTVCLVRVDDRQMLCKASYNGLMDSKLEREVDCLQKILRSFPGPARSIRVPSLLGYVTHPRSGAILGLLREWVPSRFESLDDIKTNGLQELAKDVQEKWGRQITETVDKLHNVGVIWGDAKPRNVVIDLNSDAWLIDFGGGWTDGWVDEHLEGTVEGDQQAVSKILSFLGVMG